MSSADRPLTVVARDDKLDCGSDRGYEAPSWACRSSCGVRSWVDRRPSHDRRGFCELKPVPRPAQLPLGPARARAVVGRRKCSRKDAVNARPHVIPAVAAALLLFVALGSHPYGYYTFLRWAVCIAAIVVGWVAWASATQWLTWPFVGVAILFNPLAPVYLRRATWRPIDVVCALAFLGAIVLERRLGANSPSELS